jgi:GT2 family glycosyltransferase
MAKILLTIPVPKLSLIYKECWNALLALDVGNHLVNLYVGCENLPNIVGDHNIGFNLNQARKICLTEGYDYLLIIESDVVAPPNTLLEFLKVDADVVVGLVPERPSKVGTDDFIICMDWNANSNVQELIKKGEPFEMTGKDGYACILVRRHLLEKLFFPEQGCGDMVWYDQLHKARYKIFCQPSVLCSHVDRNGKVITRKV